ncbi:MAG: tRNA pseudouridine(65) synthase TruC [Candidatus Thiodiazotropha sp.]
MAFASGDEQPSRPSPLRVLYRDDHLIAIDKPAGLLVHPSWIDRHETRSAMMLLRDQIGQYVYPVHRLDKPTSGVLLFALSPEIARRLTEVFSERSVDKRYLAVVRGYTEESGLIDYPLREKPDKMTDRQTQADKPAQSAVTAYRRLATLELPVRVDRYPSSRYSLIEARPRTGRKHQLRRHFKHLSHPIIGDTRYGKSNHNRLFAEQFGCHRLLLAATRLILPHPVSGETLTLESALDPVFARVTEGFQADIDKS